MPRATWLAMCRSTATRSQPGAAPPTAVARPCSARSRAAASTAAASLVRSSTHSIVRALPARGCGQPYLRLDVLSGDRAHVALCRALHDGFAVARHDRAPPCSLDRLERVRLERVGHSLDG